MTKLNVLSYQLFMRGFMTGKAFFLFPGQGAQYQGMALDLLESSQARGGGEKIKSLFSLASDIYGKDMADVLGNSSAEILKQTGISQPTITLANLVTAAYLDEKGIKPAGCAGFSLGEYAALAVADVISEEDCFHLVTERGKAMQAAVEEMANGAEAPGMAAVVGLAPEKVETLIDEWKKNDPGIKDLYAANYNSPKQTSVGGTAKALEKAAELFTAAGAKRVIRLQVNCPFHTPLLSKAAEQYLPFLERVKFSDPKIPLYSNVSGKIVTSGEEAKRLALLQFTSPVRWMNEEKSIDAAGGIDRLLETGPGRVLQGLWKDSGSAIPCYAAGTPADIDKLFE